MTKETTPKTCFVVMPISDIDGYDNGHFTRVYEHLIKPSVMSAGFSCIRADDVSKANYIIIDIIKKVVESDMVICDISGRNPNVLFELGIRQAFDKPVVLIKDKKTDRIFDIQGLRTVEYNESLRVDSVASDISKISKSISGTEGSSAEDVNSIIKLLGISPAKITEHIQLSKENSLLLNMIKDISDKVSRMSDRVSPDTLFGTKFVKNFSGSESGREKSAKVSEIGLGDGSTLLRGSKVYRGGNLVGRVVEMDESGIILLTEKQDVIHLGFGEDGWADLTTNAPKKK